MLHKYSVLTLMEWTRFYAVFIYFRTNLFHAPQTFRHHVFILCFFVLYGVTCNDTKIFLCFIWGMNTIRSKYNNIICRYAPVFTATEKALPTCFHHAFSEFTWIQRYFHVSSNFFFWFLYRAFGHSFNVNTYTLIYNMREYICVGCGYMRRAERKLVDRYFMRWCLPLKAESGTQYVHWTHTYTTTFDKGVPVYDYIHENAGSKTTFETNTCLKCIQLLSMHTCTDTSPIPVFFSPASHTYEHAFQYEYHPFRKTIRKR